MFRHFATVRTHSFFPLEVACGTLSCRPERIPNVAAFAAPADIVGGLEEALGTTNKTAVRTSHSSAGRLLAMGSGGATCGCDPGLRVSRTERARVLHAGDRRCGHTSQRGSKLDDRKEAKIVVWDLFQ